MPSWQVIIVAANPVHFTWLDSAGYILPALSQCNSTLKSSVSKTQLRSNLRRDSMTAWYMFLG